MAVMLVVLFGLAFLSRRRFGHLGLALAAGVLLSGQNYEFIEIFFQTIKEYLGGITPSQAAAILLCLAPSLVLMLSGRRYHSTKMRIVGALLYTVMAGFAILPFVLSATDLPSDVKNIISTSHTAAISIGIVAAVVDNFMTRHNKVEKK
jgi:hypothetical protein